VAVESRGGAARKGVLDSQEIVPRGPNKPRKGKKTEKGAKGTKPPKGASARAGLSAPPAHVWRGVAAVLVLTVALASVLAVLSFHATTGVNIIGRVGHGLAGALFGAVGICAYLVPFPMFSLGASLATSDPAQRHWGRLAALVVLALSGATLAHVVVGTHPGQEYPPGGWVGIHGGGFLVANLSFWGASLALSAIMASALVVASEGWLVRVGVILGRRMHGLGVQAGEWGWVRLQEAVEAFEERQERRAQERAEEAEYMAQILAEEEESEDDEEYDESDDESESDEDDAAEGDADEPSLEAKRATNKQAQKQAELDAAEAEAAADEASDLTATSDANRGLTEAHAEGGDPAPKAKKSRRVMEEDPAWAAPSATNAPAPASPAALKKASKAKADADAQAEKTADKAAQPSPVEQLAKPAEKPAPTLPKIVVADRKLSAPELPASPDADPEAEAMGLSDPADVRPAPPALIEKPAEKVAEKKAEPKVEKQAEKALEKATDKLAEKLAEKIAAKVSEPNPLATPVPQQPEVILAPAIIERPKVERVAPKRETGGFVMAGDRTAFELPPLEFLDVPQDKKALKVDKDIYFATAEKLRLKLKDFGIEGEVKEIHPGPVVTMYEFVPGPGIKISKIAALADDLAMAMEALRVRIVAPLPGRGSVGIEVPNRDRETVYLREIIESEKYAQSASKLTMCLGKNIEGMPFVLDLAKAPHLLMAGTTGSGKSVSVNAMIMSLLLKATPEELRFIMVDPKMLELSIYDGIPHLLLPVVTDSKKAALALQWAVDEMQRRYQLMSDAGVRNLAGYNKLIESGIVPEKKSHKADARIVVDMNEGQAPEPMPEADTGPQKKLPYIVVIIDELADLMMVASREVETSIARLAQMARAAGIHLMVATQRPSTDVVTGIIKANFPTRISFMLRSKPDSMTILGQTGAEALLGMGDMLVQPPTDSSVVRVHGAYVSEVEIKKVVDHLKEQGKPVYDENILKPRAEEGGEGGGEEDDLSDELYDQALAIVSEMKEVSISVLQRKMRIGYNRSARMIERMERDHVVGAAEGTKPRRVLIRPVGQMGAD
jgi:S-DNA-T family DNA segregation ATPase FtsK/SpoIIIE